MLSTEQFETGGEAPSSADISTESAVIAIVVPLFKHSVLVGDALRSAIGQRSRYTFVIIVVNDGCPFRESDLQVRSIQAAYPGRVRYIVQRNKGLSAARNTGIEYALRCFPQLGAIYFMDADNTILPQAIESAYAMLLESPEVSWLYPNIDMFGIRRNFDYSGPYSTLRHTQYNICEAGSLVHRRIFEAGVRFDENMKLGYEDWDFWLTAAGLGFCGAHHPHFGFRYRNRGESMLNESRRDDGEIASYMRKKHPGLLKRRSLLRLESIEALRYAILFTDTNEVLFSNGSSDPSTAIPQTAFNEILWRNITVPSRQYIPPFFITMTRTTFDSLTESGLILWVLHDCETTLQTMNIACLVLESATGHSYDVKPGGRSSESDIVAIGRDLVRAVIHSVDTVWIEQVVAPESEMKVLTKTITAPRPAGTGIGAKGSVIFAFLLHIRAWHASKYREASLRSWIWREFSVPPPHTLYYNVRAAFDGDVAYPFPSNGSRNIGFILPIASFGGVERVAYNLASQFTQAGWHVHIFVIGQTRIDIPVEFSKDLASINLLNDVNFHGWDHNCEYQGTALPSARNHPAARSRIVAALAWLDCVVNCHSGEFNASAAELRRLGVKTAAHVHLLDMSPIGRPVGHPMVTLAYEYAYDLILCTSQQLLSWMHGAGVPAEKLLHVPNAPGHPVDTATRAELLARRSESTASNLNVLYVGRLDRQKGIDRLADVMVEARELNLSIEWRVVGSRVTRDCPIPQALQGITEPAVFGSKDLTQLFGWADVMILLSDYEGVPLSVLEAQRVGVVVIATDVGAVSEIISDGENGFLIDLETAGAQTLGLLKLLIEVPTLRRQIALNASRVLEWPQAAAGLIERISVLVEAAAQS